MNKANALYTQQLSLNNLFKQAVAERESYKAKASQIPEFTARITELKDDLEGAYWSVAAMAKANASLLYDPALQIKNLTPEQERVLKATRLYAAANARNAGFNEIAGEIDKYHSITKGMQKHIDDLTPKQARKKSYEHGL